MSFLPNPNHRRISSKSGVRQVLDNPLPTRTKHADREEWDITMIIKRHTTMGTYPPPAIRAGEVFDASLLPDLQTSLLQVRKARELFEALPAGLRRELNNDATRLEPWLADPRNKELALKLGLTVARQETSPPASQGGQGAAEQGSPPAPTTPPSKEASKPS